MTLSTLWKKLRKRNKGDYRQFQFCVFFASVLISSYLIMLRSPFIQGALPQGGDSAKQVYLIFGIAALGCLVFVFYGTSLFLRKKSREIGIFMALGAKKQVLEKSLSKELGKMTALCLAAGICVGAVLSLIIGKFMEGAARDFYDGEFCFTWMGFLLAFLYGLLLFFCIRLQAGRAMKRTNLMDVINEQRKQEPMKKTVSFAYLLSGWIMTGAGILGAVFLPEIAVKLTGIFLGAWTNLFYLLAAAGLYRLLVYAVSSRQRGRFPQRYYNNLLDYGMMKFQGASVVRNMFVITVLLFGGFFALSYLPINLVRGNTADQYEADVSYRYLNDADELTREEVEELAKKHQVSVEDYREAQFLRVLGSGVERDDIDGDGKLDQEYKEIYAEYDVTGVSQYQALTGIELDIPQGGYYQITGEASAENLWFRFGDTDQFYIQGEDAFLPADYLGNTKYEAMMIAGDGRGMGDTARYVVSDQDFQRLKQGLEPEKLETQVLFDVEGEQKAKTGFAQEVYREFAQRRSEDMDVLAYYNEVTAREQGEEYQETFRGAQVDPLNPLKAADWQYAPLMVPLKEQQMVAELFSRLLLFVYVFVICLATSGIIGYTRSQSVGLTNRQTFEDIKRLGADRAYRKELLRKQIRRVFFLPAALGGGGCFLYDLLILWGNDGRVTKRELWTAAILLALAFLIWLFQYLLYRISLKKTGELLALNGAEK